MSAGQSGAGCAGQPCNLPWLVSKQTSGPLPRAPVFPSAGAQAMARPVRRALLRTCPVSKQTSDPFSRVWMSPAQGS